jgi:2,5-diamino-6-(ribosylamino)-4(3H)-pyrimidinone 5'-phosphate reductase
VPAKTLRIYPPPAQEVISFGPYEDLELPPSGRAPAGGVGGAAGAGGAGSSRPYVLLNTVSSVDGQISIQGKSSGIGSAVDRRAMRTLRSKADAVMIGAATLRAERLSLGLDDKEARAQPKAIIVSSSGEVPLGRNLISHKGQEVLLLTTEGHPSTTTIPPAGAKPSASILVAPSKTPGGAVDLGEALKILKREHSVGVLLVEGGPSLNRALISAGLVDEIFLTLAPKLFGRQDERHHHLPRLSQQPDPEDPQPSPLELLTAYLVAQELFLRYRVVETPTTSRPP